MNIIQKLGYQKHYLGSYLVSLMAIVFYLSLYFSEDLYAFIELKTKHFFNSMPFLNLHLSLYLLAISIGIVVFFTFNQIKCPKCKYNLYWNWFIGGRLRDYKRNPLMISACPNCNYDPDNENSVTGKV